MNVYIIEKVMLHSMLHMYHFSADNDVKQYDKYELWRFYSALASDN